MMSEKRIFSVFCIFALAATFQFAWASTTKVGNGDEGSDLEDATPITSGIIFETRDEALKVLKELNVQAVEGLGLLIPELEHSEMLMAKSDVRPLFVEGDLEVSEDRFKVYARTFAEPHAPTRFFPATLKLSRRQLISLHIHEALHRALPPGIREDEDRVSVLTMAIASPRASYDRVSRTAMSTLRISSDPLKRSPAEGQLTAQVPLKTEPPPTRKTNLYYKHVLYNHSQKYDDQWTMSDQLGVTFSPFSAFRILDKYTEPRLGFSGMFIKELYDSQSRLGPLSLWLGSAMILDGEAEVGPFANINFQSIETDSDPYESTVLERDTYSVGAFYKNSSPRQYTDSRIQYTLPGSYTSKYNNDKTDFGAIWTLEVKTGFKLRSFSLGGIFKLHHSTGNSKSTSKNNGIPMNDDENRNSISRENDPFNLLVAGPDLSYRIGPIQLNAAAEWLVNYRQEKTMNDLGDLAGHGAGQMSVSGSMQAMF